LIKLTAIIPTFNEEENILRALNSVDFADEIIVIDSFSSDNTEIITKEFGANFIQRKFDDFSSQKNYAIGLASHDWILMLDADEEINDALKKEIQNVLAKETHHVGYLFNRRFYFMNKLIKYGGYGNNKVIRLFNSKYCQYNGNLVHEKIKVESGSVGNFSEPIKHWSYRDFNSYIEKINKYKQLQAEQLFQENKKSSLIKILFKPKSRFLIHYFIKLGFLDGFRGFIIAVLQSYGIFIKYVALYLKTRNIK
jgi:glycosyltransferase involved in cell wall biosynthesis